MSNNSTAPTKFKTIQVNGKDEHKMEKLVEMLRRHEEMANSTSQMIGQIRKKLKEKMWVLEAENHCPKAQFVNLNYPPKNTKKEGKKDVQ